RVLVPKPVCGRRCRFEFPSGTLIERRGSLLFTHFGLSGPAVLDVSRAVTGARDARSLVVRADFWPHATAVQLGDELRTLASAEGKRQVSSFIAEGLPRRLV